MKKIVVISLAVSLLVGFLPQTLSAQSAAVHKNGTLVSRNGTVYLIRDSKRYGFRDLNEFLSWGYRFDMVVPATDADMLLSQDGIIKARAGTLAIDASDGRTVYFIFNDGARPISGDNVYIFSGFEGRAMYSINLSDYPKGAAAGFDLLYTSHPAGSLINSGDTIYLITKDGKAPFPSEAVFYSYGYEFNMVFPESRFDQILPRLAALGYRDGTLVNDQGTIFLISGGKKYGFRTWQGFVGGGYSLSAVISGGTSVYPEGEAFE